MNKLNSTNKMEYVSPSFEVVYIKSVDVIMASDNLLNAADVFDFDTIVE